LVSREGPTWTLDRFRRASRSHLSAAKYLLQVLDETSSDGVTAPSPLSANSAAYLGHVALECAFKARLLWRYNVASAEDLKRKLRDVHETLFRGRSGHDLGALAKELRLPKLLATEGKSWNDDSCWKRISHAERAYTLRYGAGSMDRDVVKEEIARVDQISGALMVGIRHVPLHETKNRR
jgi:hypothetical protein